VETALYRLPLQLSLFPAKRSSISILSPCLVGAAI